MDKYSAMTVNERLYLSSLIGDFDIAVEKKDINKVVSILKEVELTDLSIDPILKQLKLKEDD